MQKTVNATKPVYSGNRVTLWMRGHTDDFNKKFIAICDTYETSSIENEALLAQLSELGGSYAFALHMHESNETYIFVDRIGLETIYYSTARLPQQWSFDIKHLLEQTTDRTPSPQGINEILLFRFLAEEHTMYNNIKRVMPGEIVRISPDGALHFQQKPIPHYEPTTQPQNETEMIEKTAKALDNYFSRLRGINPKVGVFLSGGVDSSLLLAIAKEHSFEKLLAITCKFPGRDNPELDRAIFVAQQLNVEHKIVEISDQAIKNFFPRIISKLECPLSYFNLFAREMMFKELKGQVDIVLLGQGADSMFGIDSGASTSAIRFQKKRQAAEILPFRARTNLANTLGKATNPKVQRFVDILRYDTLSYLRNQGPILLPGKGHSELRVEDLFKNLSDIRKQYNHPLYLKFEPTSISSPITPEFALQFTQDRGLYTRNRHQVFCYTQLALEYNITTLNPFFSSDILPLGLTLKNALRSDSAGNKPILKKLACRYLPAEIVYASKMGFATPLISWLKDNEDWWRSILDGDRNAKRRLFNENAVANLEAQKDCDLILTAISFRIFSNISDAE